MSRILLDVDGVVAEFTHHLCSVIARSCDAPDPSTFTEWDFLKHHLTDLQRAHAYAVLKEPEFWATQPVIDGAQEAVELFLRKGHDVHFVTHAWGSCFGWADTRIEWIKKNFGISHKKVHVAGEKHVYSGAVFIDDKFDNVKPWHEEQVSLAEAYDRAAFLFSYPYNRSIDWSHRIDSWRDEAAMARILRIAAGESAPAFF